MYPGSWRVIENLERVKRIVEVLRLMERMRRIELADADRKLVELSAAQAEILAGLERDTAFSGLFVDLVIKRLRSVSALSEKQSRYRDARMQTWREANQRLGATTRLLDDAKSTEAARREKRELEELLDRLQIFAAQGPGKPSKRRWL